MKNRNWNFGYFEDDDYAIYIDIFIKYYILALIISLYIDFIYITNSNNNLKIMHLPLTN
jgi:hypothetical protein